MAIVRVLERGDRDANLLDVSEDTTVNRLLLKGPVETFVDAVGLRLGDEGEARRDAPELNLIDEVVCGVLRAVVRAQAQAASRLGACRAEFSLESLGNRLQGSEAIAGFGSMDADTASIEVVDRGEYPDPALIPGFDADSVRAPQVVRTSRRDRAIVPVRRALRPAVRRQQRVLTIRRDTRVRETRMSFRIRNRAQT